VLACGALVVGSVACADHSEPTASGTPAPLSRVSNPIIAENRLAASDAYEVTHHATAHELEAYVSAASVTGGESLDVHVNASVTSSVAWQLFRL